MGGGSSKSRRMYITNDDNYTSISSDYDVVISKIQRNFETELEYIKKLNNTPDIDEVHKSLGKLVVMRSKSQQVESKLRSMIPVSPKNEKSLADVTKLIRSIRYHISMLSLRVPVQAYSRNLPNIRGNDSRVKSQNYDSVALRTKKLNDDYDIPMYDKHFDVIENVLKKMSNQRKTLSKQDESALLKNIAGKLNMIEDRLKSTSKPEGASPVNIRSRSMQLKAEKNRLELGTKRDRASFYNNRRQTQLAEQALKNNSAYARAYRTQNLRTQKNQSKIVTQQLKNKVNSDRKRGDSEAKMTRAREQQNLNMNRQKFKDESSMAGVRTKANIDMQKQKLDIERRKAESEATLAQERARAEIATEKQKLNMERRKANSDATLERARSKMGLNMERRKANSDATLALARSKIESDAMKRQTTTGRQSFIQPQTQSFMSPQQQPAFVGTTMQNQTRFDTREERARAEERKIAERARAEERRTKELERKNARESEIVESRRIEKQMRLNMQTASISKANQRAAEAKETAKERRAEAKETAKERSDASKERRAEEKADAIQKRDERRSNRQDKREEEAATRNKKEAGRKEKEEINAKKANDKKEANDKRAAAKKEANDKRAAAKETANAKKNNTYTATELIDKYVEYVEGGGFNNSNRESIKTAIRSMNAIVSSQSAKMALAKREKLPKEFSKRDKIVKEAAKIYITNKFKEALRTYRQGTGNIEINNEKIQKLINDHTDAIKMYGSTVAPVYRTRMNKLKRDMDMLNPEEVYIAIESGKTKNTPTERRKVTVNGNGTAGINQKSLHPITISFFASLKPVEMFKLVDSLSTYKRTGDYFMSTFFKSGIYSGRYKEYISQATGEKLEKQFKREIKKVLQTYGSKDSFARSLRQVLDIIDDQNTNIKQKLTNSSFFYLSVQAKYIADFFTKEKLMTLKNEMGRITKRDDLYLLKKYIDAYFKSLVRTNEINFPASTVPIVQEFLKLDDLMKNIVISYIDIYKDEITELDPDEKLYESFIQYFDVNLPSLLKNNTRRVNKYWADTREKSLFDSTIPYITAYDHIERFEYFKFIKKGKLAYKEHIDTLKFDKLSKFSKSLFLVEKYSLNRGALYNDMVAMLVKYMMQKENNSNFKKLSKLSEIIFKQARKFIARFMGIKNKNDGFDFESELLTYKRKDLHDTAKYLVRVYLGLVRISGSSKVMLTGEHLEPYFGTETINSSILNHFNSEGNKKHIRLRIDQDIYPGFVKYMNNLDEPNENANNRNEIYNAANILIQKYDLFALLTHGTRTGLLDGSSVLELPKINVDPGKIDKYMNELKNDINKSDLEILIKRYIAVDGHILSQFTRRFNTFSDTNADRDDNKIFEKYVFELMISINEESKNNKLKKFNDLPNHVRGMFLITIPEHIQSLMVARGIQEGGEMKKWFSSSYVRMNPKTVLAGVAMAIGIPGIIALAAVPGGAAVIGAGIAAYGIELGATAGVGAVGGVYAKRKKIEAALRKYVGMKDNDGSRSKMLELLFKKIKEAPSNVMKVISAIRAYLFPEKGNARLRLPLPPAIPPAPPYVPVINNKKSDRNGKNNTLRVSNVPPGPSARNVKNNTPVGSLPEVPVVLPDPSARNKNNAARYPIVLNAKKKSENLNNQGKKIITMPEPPIVHPTPPRVQRNTTNKAIGPPIPVAERTQAVKGLNPANSINTQNKALSVAERIQAFEQTSNSAASRWKRGVSLIRQRKNTLAEKLHELSEAAGANLRDKSFLKQLIQHEENLVNIKRDEVESVLANMHDVVSRSMLPTHTYSIPGNDTPHENQIMHAKTHAGLNPQLNILNQTPKAIKRGNKDIVKTTIKDAITALKTYETVVSEFNEVQEMNLEQYVNKETGEFMSGNSFTLQNKIEYIRELKINRKNYVLNKVVEVLEKLETILKLVKGVVTDKELQNSRKEPIKKLDNIIKKYRELKNNIVNGLIDKINKIKAPPGLVSSTSIKSALKRLPDNIEYLQNLYVDLEIATLAEKAWGQVATNGNQSRTTQNQTPRSSERQAQVNSGQPVLTSIAWTNLRTHPRPTSANHSLQPQPSKDSVNSHSTPIN